MGMMDTLESISGLWETVGVNESGKKEWKELPDGDYTGTIKEAGTDANEHGEYAYLKIYEPSNNLTEFARWNVRNNEGAIKALKAMVSRLGLNIQSPAQLRSELPKMNGAIIEFSKKTRDAGEGKTYRNVYVNKVVEKPKTTGATTTADDDSIPF